VGLALRHMGSLTYLTSLTVPHVAYDACMQFDVHHCPGSWCKNCSLLSSTCMNKCPRYNSLEMHTVQGKGLACMASAAHQSRGVLACTHCYSGRRSMASMQYV
jgi:hypothetical protein